MWNLKNPNNTNEQEANTYTNRTDLWLPDGRERMDGKMGEGK